MTENKATLKKEHPKKDCKKNKNTRNMFIIRKLMQRLLRIIFRATCIHYMKPQISISLVCKRRPISLRCMKNLKSCITKMKMVRQTCERPITSGHKPASTTVEFGKNIRCFRKMQLINTPKAEDMVEKYYRGLQEALVTQLFARFV